MRGDYPKSLEIHERSLEIRLEINDLYGIVKSYMNMGPVYSNQGDYISALNVYEKSLAISEPNNFERLISASLNNIGAIYNSQEDYVNALAYFSQGLILAKQINNKRVEANLISNISVIYRVQGNWDSALVYANNGLDIFLEIGDIKGAAGAYESIGLLYYSKGDYDESIDFESKALEIRKEIDDKLGLASSMIYLGQTNIQKRQVKQGEDWCKKGLEMAITVGSLSHKKDACKCLSETSSLQNNWKEAFEYHQRYTIYSDSLKTNETTKRLQQLEFAKQMVRDSVAYQNKRKEIQIAQDEKIHRRNSLQFTGIAILLFLFVSWWYFARNLILPDWLVELLLFVPFLVFFRFLTILISPFTSEISNDEPFYQLLLSIVLTAIITPTHQFFERKVRKKIFDKRERISRPGK
jgi:tetratricopeptide (TPR) repeat protein